MTIDELSYEFKKIGIEQEEFSLERDFLEVVDKKLENVEKMIKIINKDIIILLLEKDLYKKNLVNEYNEERLEKLKNEYLLLIKQKDYYTNLPSIQKRKKKREEERERKREKFCRF